MLRQLRALDKRFKAVEFKPNLNLIVADRTGGSSGTDSRNGVGKSSLVEILHLLLGGNISRSSVLARAEVTDIQFQLSADWWTSPSGSLEIRRQPDRASEVYLDHDIRNRHAPRDERVRISNTEWQRIIERDLFAMQPEHPGISGRAMLSLYMRRSSSNAFNDSVKTHPQQSSAEASANVAYLLGLDWQLASRYRDLAARESMRRKLAEASKDPVWGRIVGRSSELRGVISVAQQRVLELERQISSFRVVPEYERLQQQADEIDQRIRQMRLEGVIDRRNLRDLESAIEDASDPEVDYLQQVYDELGVVLGSSVQRRYEEVQDFHSSVVRNRRLYLKNEISAIRSRLADRERAREELGDRHAEILQTLNQGGALDALAALQQSLAHERASVEALRNRFEAAQTLEASRAEIKAERSALESEIRADLFERDRIIDEASVRFLNYARRLYGSDRQAYLQVDPAATHLRIVPFIESQESHGIKNMVTFCFDLTIAVTALRGNRGPDFLVHDSQLFDGVDERQVAQALSLAKEIAEEEGLQYIVSMNSDDLAKAESQGVDLSAAVIPPRLTDKYDDGGLFGFRF